MTGFAKRWAFNPYRKTSGRAGHRSAAEKEASVRCFFEGTTLTHEGKQYHMPGWNEAMNLVWSHNMWGLPLCYRDHPERIGSGDESYVIHGDKTKGVVPLGVRHSSKRGGTQPPPLGVFSFCTFTGHHVPDKFIWQAKASWSNPMRGAAPGCLAVVRPDGYMMTWSIFKQVLEKLATEIPGAQVLQAPAQASWHAHALPGVASAAPHRRGEPHVPLPPGAGRRHEQVPPGRAQEGSRSRL